MKNYLDNRGGMYVSESFPEGDFGEYNTFQICTAVLNKIKRVGDAVGRTVGFLSEEEESVIGTADRAIEMLETKLQVMQDAIEYSSRLKLDMGGKSADISVVDLSKGMFVGMNYSVTDSGVILNSLHGENFR